ncbi:MAG: HTH domain-containing protein [Cryomorphaceae bacterium]|nr:HTH domain-containing protein [Cryomorphaceae bacterium]
MFPEKEFGKKSEARNRLLADLLSRTNFMEKAGTGIKRMTDSCKSNGNKVEFSFSDSFWIAIHSNQDNENRVGEKVGEKVGENLTENQQKIIQLIEVNNKTSAKKIAKEIGISSRKVEENIAKLKHAGVLIRIGPAKGGYWQVRDAK